MSPSSAPTLPFQPKALAETIDESFTKPLPNINKRPDLGDKVAPSSTGTINTTPPKLWLGRDISDYTTPAERALGEQHVQKVTIQHCIPTLESTHKIECEPDVVRPAALYLLHPVHMALKALHPGISIQCMSEPYDNGRKIRPDVVYKKDGEVFAILEYKVPGAVDKKQFAAAMVPWATSKAVIAERKQYAVDKGNENSLFTGKSVTLIKQITRYVEKTPSTRYAALFNWDFMFLTTYDALDTELIYGTLISRTDTNTADKLRKAYLGWLMEALDNSGVCKLDPPGGRYLPSDGHSQKKGDGSGPDGGHGDGSNTGSRTASPGASDKGPASGDQASNSGNTAGIPSRRKEDSGNNGKTVTAPVRSESPAPTPRQVTGGKPVKLARTASPLRHAHGETASTPAPARGGQQPATGGTGAKAQSPQHSGPAKKAPEPKAMQPASQHEKPAKKAQQGTESSSGQSPASAAVAKVKKSAAGSSLVQTRSQKRGG